MVMTSAVPVLYRRAGRSRVRWRPMIAVVVAVMKVRGADGRAYSRSSRSGPALDDMRGQAYSRNHAG